MESISIYFRRKGVTITKHPTDPILDAELARLNEAVLAAIRARREWMDAHMGDYSKVQVGEMLYDVSAGRPLGIVTSLYRYWQDRNWEYDTNMSIDACYQLPQYPSGNVYDNTSRQIGVNFGTEAEALRRMKSLVACLESTSAAEPK